MSVSRANIVLLSRQAPYGSHRPQLCLDVALASAVFEQEVSYVFLDDGVYQLVKDQDGETISSKSLDRQLETLELYGIDKVYIDRESLQSRRLDMTDLVLTAEIVDRSRITKLLAESNTVINL